jgi:hypothetical protein
MRVAALTLPALLLAATAAVPEGPMQTIAAFKTAVSYQYSCDRDVFSVRIGAVPQAAGAESTLYWEIADSGQTPSGGVQNIAMLETLQVPSAAATPQAGGFAPATVSTKAYRSCSAQSLYVWAASGATKLPNGDIVVDFANAVEQPLPRL